MKKIIVALMTLGSLSANAYDVKPLHYCENYVSKIVYRHTDHMFEDCGFRDFNHPGKNVIKSFSKRSSDVVFKYVLKDASTYSNLFSSIRDLFLPNPNDLITFTRVTTRSANGSSSVTVTHTNGDNSKIYKRETHYLDRNCTLVGIRKDTGTQLDFYITKDTCTELDSMNLLTPMTSLNPANSTRAIADFLSKKTGFKYNLTRLNNDLLRGQGPTTHSLFFEVAAACDLEFNIYQ